MKDILSLLKGAARARTASHQEAQVSAEMHRRRTNPAAIEDQAELAKHRERELRERIIKFRGGDRLSRQETHERAL